ncbi:hypothetical protein CHLRE_01g018150v5 [Chlamydomonas reinhardtii]|uniref:Uncharacterized protein n=1 Tax=Chlamydomonas reinhardtii TaxID=3055 RepID=A0A2K3E5V9_CHLRE|nr:uncharacterized protein CHLRE_01g018150v5 [Chlamydomonas reinhardtii]PNW88188.1 hypothetical protein CHLRE_01g018150v5 [Chlamydomonas reinhardtii]
MQPAGDNSGSSCGPWWSAWVSNARADSAAGVPPSCRDFIHVSRDCRLDRTERGTFLHCHERRELFKLCTDREPEKVSTTSIETREPLLDGHTLVATPSTRFELTPPQLESPASNSDGADAAVLHQHQQLAQQQPLQQQAERPPSPGRFSHPWRVHADDGGLGNHAGAGAGWARARAESGDMSSTAAASSSSTSGFNSSGNTGSSCSGSCSTSGGGLLLTPQVGQAMDDIFLFADEMQRELAQHGLQLMRRGEAEEQQRRKQLPGFLGRLFGAREAMAQVSEGLGCGGVGPLRSSDYVHQPAATPPAGGAGPQ